MAGLRDERGQTTAEFVGMLVVVAAIVAVVGASGIVAVARGGTERTVCSVLNADDCERTGESAQTSEMPSSAAAANGPENYARVPQPTLAEQAEQVAGRALTGIECAALERFDPHACGAARTPGPLTDEEIRRLYVAFSGDAGEANQLLCGVDVFFAESSDLAGACQVLREVTGTTTGDEALVALELGLRRALELERNLPLVDELLRALEIAQGETLDGEPLSNAQRLRNLLAIAASILPADEVAQLAAIARRGNADEVAAHIDEALEATASGADELQSAATRGDAFLEGHALWTPGKPGIPSRNAYQHYLDHGSDFPDVNNSLEYVRKAHDYLRHPPPGTLTRVRDNGDVIRYDPATEWFGIMKGDGTPMTFYIPDPKVHGRRTNLEYFEEQGDLPPQ